MIRGWHWVDAPKNLHTSLDKKFHGQSALQQSLDNCHLSKPLDYIYTLKIITFLSHPSSRYFKAAYILTTLGGRLN